MKSTPPTGHRYRLCDIPTDAYCENRFPNGVHVTDCLYQSESHVQRLVFTLTPSQCLISA